MSAENHGSRAYGPSADKPAVGAEDLITAIARSGDRTAFRSLFVTLAPKLKAYFLRFGISDPQAEEMMQETLLRVWRNAYVFDPGRSSAAGWIFTIARNLRIDVLRRERHPDDLGWSPPASAPTTPEQILRSVESEKLLHGALATLPAEQAQVIKLAFLEEQSHSQIAAQLGLPLGTVKSRIRLAAAHLRQILDRFE